MKTIRVISEWEYVEFDDRHLVDEAIRDLYPAMGWRRIVEKKGTGSIWKVRDWYFERRPPQEAVAEEAA